MPDKVTDDQRAAALADLRSPIYQRQQAALRLLAEHHEPQLIPALIAIVQDTPNPLWVMR